MQNVCFNVRQTCQTHNFVYERFLSIPPYSIQSGFANNQGIPARAAHMYIL